MNYKNVLAIIGGTILLVSILAVMGYVIKTQRDIINSIDGTAKEQKLLQDNITRIESTLLTSKAFDAKLKTLDMDMKVVRNDLASVGGKVDGILQSSAKTPGVVYVGVPSSGSTPVDDNDKPPIDPNCPNCFVDRYGYFSNIQKLELAEPLSNGKNVPFGFTEFNTTKENPWSYTVLPRTYSSTFVLATDAAGKRRAYGKVSITPKDGKRYDLPEIEVKYYEKYPEPQFFLWNPRAMVGIDGGYSTNPDYTIMPSAQLFIASHGKTRRDTKWYIGGVGVGYDIVTNNYNLLVTPFSYKVTSYSSIFQNINVGPSIGVDTHGMVYGGVGLRFGL